MTEQESNVEKITDQEQSALIEARRILIRATEIAKSAESSRRMAELEHRNLVQQVFLAHEMTIRDTINEETGIITRVPKKVVEPEIVEPEIVEDVEDKVEA
jgi:hypothetical protein